jgi:hypothetical protein
MGRAERAQDGVFACDILPAGSVRRHPADDFGGSPPGVRFRVVRYAVRFEGVMIGAADSPPFDSLTGCRGIANIQPDG